MAPGDRAGPGRRGTDSADFGRMSEALAAAHRRWPTGIYLLWYPIKGRAARRARREAAKAWRAGFLRSERTLGPPRAEAGLVGSGLVAVNPLFMLERDLLALIPALGGLLSPTAARVIDRRAAERQAGG
jgi:23S rRNA (adenine2030-N6)-methyltransferase